MAANVSIPGEAGEKSKFITLSGVISRWIAMLLAETCVAARDRQTDIAVSKWYFIAQLSRKYYSLMMV